MFEKYCKSLLKEKAVAEVIVEHLHILCFQELNYRFKRNFQFHVHMKILKRTYKNVSHALFYFKWSKAINIQEFLLRMQSAKSNLISNRKETEPDLSADENWLFMSRIEGLRISILSSIGFVCRKPDVWHIHEKKVTDPSLNIKNHCHSEHTIQS